MAVELLNVQSGTRKPSSGISARGQKKDPIPRLRRPNGSIAKNDADKAQILAFHFETVFTRESSLPEVASQSRTNVAKIKYVQITCGEVKRI